MARVCTCAPCQQSRLDIKYQVRDAICPSCSALTSAIRPAKESAQIGDDAICFCSNGHRWFTTIETFTPRALAGCRCMPCEALRYCDGLQRTGAEAA